MYILQTSFVITCSLFYIKLLISTFNIWTSGLSISLPCRSQFLLLNKNELAGLNQTDNIISNFRNSSRLENLHLKINTV